MRRALIAILAAAVIAVIVGGLAIQRMVRDFTAEPYSDVSTQLATIGGETIGTDNEYLLP